MYDKTSESCPIEESDCKVFKHVILSHCNRKHVRVFAGNYKEAFQIIVYRICRIALLSNYVLAKAEWLFDQDVNLTYQEGDVAHLFVSVLWLIFSLEKS